MGMVVQCPHCAHPFSAPAELAGKPGRCPTCGGESLLPESPPAPAAHAPPVKVPPAKVPPAKAPPVKSAAAPPAAVAGGPVVVADRDPCSTSERLRKRSMPKKGLWTGGGIITAIIVVLIIIGLRTLNRTTASDE